jgi:hypothetical protein
VVAATAACPFDHPPINTIAATTVAELSELVAATIEAQQRCEVWSRRVVVSGRLAAY